MTSAFDWRAIFWFLSITSGLSLLSFVLFFRDTFRRERSLTYQNVIKQRRKAATLSSLNIKKSALGVDKNDLKGDITEPHEETSLTINLDVSLADVNPLKPLGQVFRRKNNVIALFSSGNDLSILSVNALTDYYAGFQFAFTNLISYACARTLSTHYGYNPLRIGFVTLSFGIGKSLLTQDLSSKLIIYIYCTLEFRMYCW